MDATAADELLRTDTVRRALADIDVASVISDLPGLAGASQTNVPNLNWLLGLASWLADIDSEIAQTALLRISHFCLTRADAEREQRAAALVLLERVGNQPTIALARERALLAEIDIDDLPSVVQLDVARSRMTLAIPADGAVLGANHFQRDFWTLATNTDWLSVSASTSAGKSFIVRRWFGQRLTDAASFTGIYIVPTRALIDEVSRELRSALPTGVPVIQFPWDARAGESDREIYVLTQERLHLLLDRDPNLTAGLVFVDEAQKFGDDARGVLLQRTLDDISRRSGSTQVIFASPLSDNPELLLEAAPSQSRTASMTGHAVTVLQNLLWANQVRGRPTRWTLDLIDETDARRLGEFDLPARPTPDSKRLPYVAIALTGESGSSVVYANGAADAEKMAAQIADALPQPAALSPDITALIELSEHTVHRQYALGSVLRRGVAFHYGNMPQLLRSEIERLFREGEIRYLVCTSTLLEGVNLPCRNLFMRGPTRGRGNPLRAADFWNLAGRAGRWGKEFQGNVVCVDASVERVWKDPPRRRVRYPLVRATDTVLAQPQALLDYIAAGTPVGEGQGRPPLESVFSLLCSRVASGQPLANAPDFASTDAATIAALEQAVASALDPLDIPTSLILRHAGISPVSMQRLLDLFRSYTDKSDLAIALPESDDAVAGMVSALGRISKTIASPFGELGRTFMLALLIIQWMRGYPLARIIAGRIGYLQRNNRSFDLARVIRECMTDVEQHARFEAPKYLACYVDILRLHLDEEGLADDMAALPDMAMLLELGVSRTTELSLMTLGLSRSAAIAVGEFIAGDELDAEACIAWLRANDLESLAIPALIRREVAKALEGLDEPER